LSFGAVIFCGLNFWSHTMAAFGRQVTTKSGSRAGFAHGRITGLSFPSPYLSAFDSRLKSIRPWKNCVVFNFILL